MQQSIVHKSPQRGMWNSWEWISVPFSVWGAYKRLCEGQSEENHSINSACSFLWQQKVPLKVRLLRWLLLWKRLMTRVFHRRLYPESSAACGLCSSAEEDCAHLFFECSFARSICDRQTSSRVDTTSESSFWESIRKSSCRRRMRFAYSRCSRPYGCTGTTRCSTGGRHPLTGPPMLWRVLW